MFSRKMLAKMIDFTVLRPDLTREAIIDVAQTALNYHFAALVVQPYWIRVVARELRGSDVKICCPVGFPFGTTTIATKVIEAKGAIAGGATELDVMINLGALKSHKLKTVRQDLQEVVYVAKSARLTQEGAGEIMVKLGVECGYLTDDELKAACEIGRDCGIDFIKTCSGYGPRGATLDDIRKIRSVVGREIGVKASGGIGTLRDASKMLDAGANRIGATAAVSIVDEAPDDDDDNGGRRRRRRRRTTPEGE
ncbi:MAG: deoxyribose-phosphate aldolase [Fimbriimonadaceae bacterium]|nr:deoxyribose-phosphate aldolase [Fimbriimonadaceae bacterium]